MKRTFLYSSFAVVAASITLAASRSAISQGSVNTALVRLQAESPGYAQAGNINLSGAVVSSSFEAKANLPTCIISGVNASNGAGSVGVCGVSLGSTGYTYGVQGTSTSSNGTGVWGEATSSGGGVANGVTGTTNSDTGRGVFAIAQNASGAGLGVYALSYGSSGFGVYGSATSPTGATHGVYGDAVSPNGIGVRGVVSSSTGTNIGVYGQTQSSQGKGVYGQALNGSGGTGVSGQANGPFGAGVYGENLSNSGTTYGGRFWVFSPDSRAVSGLAFSTTGTSYGGHFVNDSATGYGVYATASGAALSASYGVWGQTLSRTGVGVYGLASDSTTSYGLGAYGESRGTVGIGVGAFAPATTGPTTGLLAQANSTNGIAVFGDATATSGTTYGVFGRAVPGGGRYAVFANGDMGASGLKPFRIDHPQDPANKYLLHYSAESPMPQNFYSGNVVTDEKGYAWVELPDYFEDINTNFKYQLTVVDGQNTDDFVMAKVALRIKGGRFLVRTSQPGVEVSWRVEADRNDLYTRARKPKDVVDKEGSEIGTYQMPELYGMPEGVRLNQRLFPTGVKK